MSSESKSARSELPTTRSSQLARDVTFVEAIEQDCICPICTYVADDPRSCGSCASLFCRTCLEKALRRGPACPTCRSAVTSGGIRIISVSNIIQGRRVYCCNWDACDWAGKYEELERHLNVWPREGGMQQSELHNSGDAPRAGRPPKDLSASSGGLSCMP